MQILGIGAQPDAGVVEQEPARLRSEREPDRRHRGCPAGNVRGAARNLEIERPIELRAQLAGCGAGLFELPHEPSQRPLVATHELHLELAKPPRHALALEHRDGVVDDLRTVRAHDLAPRPQPRDPAQLAAAQEPDEERRELERRPRRRTGLLQLGARGAAGKLQLPEARPVLDPVTQRDPVPREHEVAGVVVRGDEDPGRLRFAAELREHEPLARA